MSPTMSTASVSPLGPAAEAQVFLGLRARLAWSTIRGLLATARLRISLVVLLSLVFWGALYGLFAEAFAFLDALHADVVPLLFNAFFTSLMVMLVFSVGILLYAGMYCTPEARLLLTLPARPEAIFGHFFRESLWFAGWGFLLLGSPMLVAYGVVRDAPWQYHALVLPFMAAFVVIPASLGAISCMLLVAWLPRLRLHALTATATIAVALAVWLVSSIIAAPRVDALSAGWFARTLAGLSFTEQKVFPSWWLCSGLLEAARRDGTGAVGSAPQLEALAFLAVLASNALVLQIIAARVARGWYRLGASRLAAEVPSRRRRPLVWIDRLLGGGAGAAGRPLRLLMVKDLRLFRRDVSQWSQFLIFFGLLALYFFNLRSFNYNNSYAALVGSLNLAVVSLILSTFTTRFVYPMISLEGRRFWILGLLPVHRDQIVWSKFAFAVAGGLPTCCALVFLSDMMLGLAWPLVLLHEYCCVVLCIGLAGIAVGIGARMPELGESSPAKISSGFGGTLSLVLSSLFIMAVVVVSTIPVQTALVSDALRPARLPLGGILAWAAGPWGMAAALAIVLVCGLAATCIPMTLGLRAFRRLEP